MTIQILLRTVIALLAAISLSGCAGMYFKDAGAPPPASRHTLEHWPYKEYWTGIVFNGAKVGFTHLAISPATDEPGRYQIDSEAVFVLHFLGLEKKFVLRSRDRVNADLTLASFDYDLNLDGNRQTLHGTVTDGKLIAEVEQRGSREHQEFVTTGPVYPTSIMSLYPLLHGLEVGREYRYTVFDGELRKLAEAQQKVEGYETSELFSGPAFKLTTRLHGHSTQSWMNAEGKPVLELALNGVLISALEDERRARQYLAQASLNKQEVLLDFSRVPADRAIPQPRSRRALEVAFTGLDVARLPPVDAVQACRANGGETRCRLPASRADLPALSNDDDKLARYLEPTLSAPSVDPRIRDTAAQIAAGASSDTEKVARLVSWIQANIRREPVDVFSALDVLEGRKAECQGHAYLYAAFARSLGIPTRVVNGLVYVEEVQGFLYHSWNESRVGDTWQPVDATFGQTVADATHVKLVEGETPAELAPLLDVIGRLKARVIAFE